MIRLSKSVLGKEEIEAVESVLEKEFLGMGNEVKNFENELSKYFGRKAICVNSGTAALHLAFQAIGLTKGDEVLVQSLTFIATYQAISATGAKPIPCEIDEETFTIDLDDAEKKITDKTKAIVPVHYMGNVGDLNGIYEFAEKHNLRVIEDAAHAFGSYYNSKLVGRFGDIACFSFDGIKNITSGEGGAIVTNNSDVIQKCSDSRLLGVEKDSERRYNGQRSWDFDVKSQGWRYHMSDIMAAIGRVQLSKVNIHKQIRQKLAKHYVKRLIKLNGILFFDFDYNSIIPHIFVIRILNGKRDEIRNILSELGIQTGIHYKPNHLLSYYKSKELPITEKVYKQILTLPLHTDLKIEDVDFICDTLIDLI